MTVKTLEVSPERQAVSYENLLPVFAKNGQQGLHVASAQVILLRGAWWRPAWTQTGQDRGVYRNEWEVLESSLSCTPHAGFKIQPKPEFIQVSGDEKNVIWVHKRF